jgi:hypothetical protein
MMNLIQKFFSKDFSNKTQTRKNFSQYFFSLPEHQWLKESMAMMHFERLFQHLPVGVLEAMMTKYPIVFIPSETFREIKQQGRVLNNTIVIFPEFQKLIHSNKKSAIAYLAHELAFVLYELESRPNDFLMAEVEADKFVCDLGLINELEELLLMLDETIEKRLRLTYLTIHTFTESGI